MQTEQLLKLVKDTVEEKKGQHLSVIDVRGKTSVTDYMVLVTGTSNRHVKALAEYVEINVKEQGFKPLGIEGEQGAEWVLLDLGDVILHVMTAQTREFYQLEKLWNVEYSENIEQAAAQ